MRVTIRCAFSPRVLLHIGRGCLEDVESDFRGLGFELSLEDFASTILKHAEANDEDDKDTCTAEARQERREALVDAICELFAEIDLNGDGTVEWTEFMQHCVDAGLASSKAHSGKPAQCVGGAGRAGRGERDEGEHEEGEREGTRYASRRHLQAMESAR